MSRYALDPAQIVDPATHTVVVGWDSPMQTYFAHVIDRKIAADEDDDRDSIVVWLGGTIGEFEMVGSFQAALKPYALLSDDLRASLKTDQERGY